jgi:hypothetical protein
MLRTCDEFQTDAVLRNTPFRPQTTAKLQRSGNLLRRNRALGLAVSAGSNRAATWLSGFVK